jgi:hypothetical protein
LGEGLGVRAKVDLENTLLVRTIDRSINSPQPKFRLIGVFARLYL